jgi:hypothetical protein
VIRLSWLPDSERVRWSGSGEGCLHGQQVTDPLTSRFPPQQNGGSPVVFHVAKGKITDAANKQAVESSYKALSKAPHVASAPDPFANAASGLVSKDAKTAFTPVLLDIPFLDIPTVGPTPATMASAYGPGYNGPVLTATDASAPPSACWWRPSTEAGGWTWSVSRPRTGPCPSPATCP